MRHPEELLAAYVDGTLGESERAEVDAHLGTCESCREDIVLAGRARTVLATLPELDVPPDTVRPGLGRKAPRRRPDRFRRTAWATGFAAAAGIAAILAVVLVSNPTGNNAAPTAGGAPSEAIGINRGVVRSHHNYDASAIQALAGDFAHRVSASGPPVRKGAGAAGAGGGVATTSGLSQASSPSAAPTPGEKFAPNALVASPKACVRSGSSLSGPVTLLQVIEAKYRGRGAYIGVFLRDGLFPSAVVISVVSRSDCAFLTQAEQRLP